MVDWCRERAHFFIKSGPTGCVKVWMVDWCRERAHFFIKSGPTGCVKVEVAVLGSPSLISLMVSVKQR